MPYKGASKLAHSILYTGKVKYFENVLCTEQTEYHYISIQRLPKRARSTMLGGCALQKLSFCRTKYIQITFLENFISQSDLDSVSVVCIS